MPTRSGVDGSGFFTLIASGDVSPFSNVKVTSIVIACPAASAGGATTLRAGGVDFFTKVIYPDELTKLEFGAPWWVNDLSSVLVGTGVVVTVFYA